MAHRNVTSGLVIGVDLGDKHSHLCLLDKEGEVLEESRIRTTSKAFAARFEKLEPALVLLETGTHSNWVHDLLKRLGHRAVVADARRLRAISSSDRKDDRSDAEMLARLGRADLHLIHEVRPQDPALRRDRTVLRARAALVEARTQLVNHLRGVVKSEGERLAKCSAESLHKQPLPETVAKELHPIRVALATLTKLIGTYDRQIATLCAKYPRTALLQQVARVGPITSLCFVLTIGDTRRFKDSRQVGPYLGLVPKRRQSGNQDPDLGITKSGDGMLRSLLVQCAHQILSEHGPDCDLKRFGTRLCRGAERASKNKAVVATARKLAVVLFALLRNGEVYRPLRHAS